MADHNNVSELTDSQLRVQLLTYGVKCGPITTTTRALFEKKLRKFLEGAAVAATNGVGGADNPPPPAKEKSKTNRRSSAGRRASKKFAAYSSDEDDLNGVAEPAKKSLPNDIISQSQSPVSTSIGTSPIPQKPSNNEFVDPNDVLIPTPAKNSPLTTVRSRRSFAGTPSNSVSKSSTPLKPLRNEFSDDELPSTTETAVPKVSTRKSVGHVPSGSQTNTNNTNHVNHNNEPLPPPSSDAPTTATRNVIPAIPPSLRPTTTTTTRTSTTATELPPEVQDELNTSLKELRRSYVSKRPSPNFSVRAVSDRYQFERGQDDDVDEEDEEEEEIDAEFVVKSSYLGMLREGLTWQRLLLLAVVAALVGVYLYNGANSGIPRITDGGAAEKDAHKQNTYRIVNCLYQKLSVLAGDAECGAAETRWVKISSLPRFASSCLQEGESFNIILDNVKTTYGDFFAVNEEGEVSSRFVYRSLGCRINQAVSVVMLRVIVMIGILSLCIAGYFYQKRRWSREEEETRQTLKFSEKIITMLKKHQEALVEDASLRAYIPIMHARDELILLEKRNDTLLMRAWNKAVASVNCDSRVRLETQRVSGEDMDCWRWIAVVAAPKPKKEVKEVKKATTTTTTEQHLSNDHEKCWQGPAFDQLEKVVRMPIVTPTPCLKIRYMHEGSEEKAGVWVRQVENAIIEKCAQVGSQILHIYVDKSSKEGCVYVKCDSLESAGKAFRSMYGNWFDSRLLVVKFVTLARYHQRFPDALTCSEPLRCDKQVPTSLNWVAGE